MIGTWQSTEKELNEWLTGLLDPERFDLVVTVERKATAIVRALIDLAPGHPCKWKWTQVLSSDAIQYLPKNWLQDRRILVFNELVRHGHTTARVLREMHENTRGSTAHAIVASFGVHEDFLDARQNRYDELVDGPLQPWPHVVYFSGVKQQRYVTLREQLIQILRRRGALLLDTEHIESTFRLTIPYSRLLESLSRIGTPITYDDDGDDAFPGVTLQSPLVGDLDHLRSLLPEECNLEAKAPRKIRLVRRGPTEFAFVPIWYPAVRADLPEVSQRWPSAPSFLRRSLDNCPPEKLAELSFHLASLLTGIELLRAAWAAVANLVNHGVKPDVLHGSTDPESPLGHLRSLYPLIDFDELERAVDAAIAGYEDSTLVKRLSKIGRRVKSVTPPFVGADARREQCELLLGRLVLDRRRVTIEEEWADDFAMPDDKELEPFAWREFWDLGSTIGVSETVRTIIMDSAIDNALLKTTHTRVVDNEREFVIRGFAPDSEFALEHLERIALGAEKVVLND